MEPAGPQHSSSSPPLPGIINDLYVCTVDRARQEGIGSGMGLWPQNSKRPTKYDRLNTKIIKLLNINYEQNVVVLKLKSVINFKTIEGADFFPPVAEFCAGLADNFRQELAESFSFGFLLLHVRGRYVITHSNRLLIVGRPRLITCFKNCSLNIIRIRQV